MKSSDAGHGAHKRFQSNRSFLDILPANTRYERWGPKPREAQAPWPRRLLHVSTMTSLERTAINTYGKFKAPPYHALSYTWGRYADRSGESIRVTNIPWSIPQIKDSHFSAKDLESAIRVAGMGADFVWVDVACIDQEDPNVKMDEIGKQAAIFQRASKVYTWLAPWKIEDLEGCLSTLESFCRIYYEPEHGGPSAYAMKSTFNASTRSRTTLTSLLKAVRDLTIQPWFTSLWTLQEAYLCKEASILSRSSTTPMLRAIIDESYTIPIPLQWILVRCQQIFTACVSREEPLAKEVCQLLIDSGLLSLSSHNQWTLYIASTKRQASVENDRIYGIMQIYNVSLGLQPSFSALQDSFGFILNDDNPVLSQLHVHENPPTRGKSWRVSTKMNLPYIFMYVLSSQPACKIYSSPRGIPFMNGKSVDLVMLLDAWRIAMLYTEEHGKEPYQAHVLLDAHTSQPSKVLELFGGRTRRRSGVFKSQWSSEVHIDSLTDHLPMSLHDCKVLLLGHVKVGDDEVFSYAVGLLAAQHREVTGRPWVRAGVCLWEDEPSTDSMRLSITFRTDYVEEEIPIAHDVWRTFEGRLG